MSANPTQQPRRDPESLAAALNRVSESGQRMVERRVDLLLKELEALLTSGALVAVGGVVALVGWVYLLGVAVDVLAAMYSRRGVELTIGFVHIVLGAVIVWRARRLSDAGTGT